MKITVPPELKRSPIQAVRKLADDVRNAERRKAFETGTTGTHVFRFKSQQPFYFHGLGKFYLARFSLKENDTTPKKDGFEVTQWSIIFIYLLEDKDFKDDWSKAIKKEFNVKYKIDLQKFQQEFEKEKKKAYVKVSPIFIKR
jgi:hypothetical protein